MSAAAVQFSMADLARRLGEDLQGDGEVMVRGINTLTDAGDDELTFITKGKFVGEWKTSQAAGAIVDKKIDSELFRHDAKPLIFVPDAELACLELLGLFMPPPTLPDVGVHPTSWVHAEASVDPTARIGPHVSVDRGAVVEAGVVLHGGVRIGAEVRIGTGTTIHGNTVILERCEIGRNVIMYQNVSIGADGFGYRPAPDGSGLLKMPHIGTVVIEDDVEIGASTCIDRGKFGATRIGQGTKIDNLVQIAHNCRIGRSCVIAGQTGIGGSVVVGDNVQMGGAVGIVDHLKIGDGAKIGARSLATKDLAHGETYLGYPADLANKTLRQWAAIRKLPDLVQSLSRRTRSAE